MRSTALNCCKNIAQPPINTITDSLPKERKKNLLNSLLRQRSIYTFYKKDNSSLYLYSHFKCQLSLIYTPFNAILLSSRIYYNRFRAKRLCFTTKFIQLSLSLYIYVPPRAPAEITLSFSTKFRTSQFKLPPPPPPPRSARQTRTTIYLTVAR